MALHRFLAAFRTGCLHSPRFSSSGKNLMTHTVVNGSRAYFNNRLNESTMELTSVEQIIALVSREPEHDQGGVDFRSCQSFSSAGLRPVFVQLGSCNCVYSRSARVQLRHDRRSKGCHRSFEERMGRQASCDSYVSYDINRREWFQGVGRHSDIAVTS